MFFRRSKIHYIQFSEKQSFFSFQKLFQSQKNLQKLLLTIKTKYYMSTEAQSVQFQDFNINSSFASQQIAKKQLLHLKVQKFPINPRLSILQSSIDPSMSKLEIYKQHFINIQLRKQVIPHVPEPSVISCFNMLKKQKSFSTKKEKLKKQIQAKKLEYEKLKKTIDKYHEIYESKEESLKQKILLAKILSTKLESQFDKTKEKFRELEFSKIMNTAQKKLYFYQLAEIFFNEKTRSIFSFDKELSRTDEQFGTCLGYLAFLISNVAKITGVEMWLKLKFRGPRSTITVYDTKMIETFSNTSTSQNSGLIVTEQTYLLHPKQQRLNQALTFLCEQLKQIMKYNLGISVGKGNNFYELCEELSRFLLKG